MSAQLLFFHRLLQEPIEAGVITPAQAFAIEFDSIVHPTAEVPLSLRGAWERIDLFFCPAPASAHQFS